ncbi:hypothetical protein QR680_012193 [Steinernema hermaphroditum]|uniref:DNA-directed DNA polymerase n=1 Tax=Steinernema hermaphroditum TaxID=289476 RepID=A0AA39M045_9BILA|nr:hypothetical protein QR680_012193 [Steinernema hermaphroditum]
MSKEEKEIYLRECEDKMDLKLDREKIAYNPGLRYLAKLALNSFWGKWGQRGILVTTHLKSSLLVPQVTVLLGLRAIWEIQDDTEQDRLTSVARIVNFLPPEDFRTRWLPVPLLPGGRHLTPFELQILNIPFGYTEPNLSSPEERDHFDDVIVVVRFFAPHIIERYE